MTAAAHPAEFRIAALYRFCPVDDPAERCRALDAFCRARGIRGTVLLAAEGINGTLAGSDAAIAALVEHLRGTGFDGMEVKYSWADAMPFHRLKVRVKREIVTIGVAGLEPARNAGRRVAPSDWNALIGDPQTVVIDTRNAYEVALGTFRNAVDPRTESFRDFPAWLRRHQSGFSGRKVAMFCTGGIRCEKATAYAQSIGLGPVYHLQGGILRYLEEMTAAESLWQGECFVFDERVAVGHGLAVGEAVLCRGCRRPLTRLDQSSPHYAEGISCAHCHDRRSEADRARYAERQRQVALAARRGGAPHIGG